MINRLIILLIVIAFVGCKSGQNITPISGVWKMEKYINSKYVDEVDSYGEQFPILYDFKSNGELQKIILGFKDTTFSFRQIDNSTITVQGLPTIIQEHNDSVLILKYIEHNDTMLAFFKKPLNVIPNVDTETIKSKLISNRWTVDTSKHYLMNDFELFESGVGIFRCKLEEGTNLQEELWGVEEYDGQIYFYLKSNIELGNGNINLMYQIIDYSSDRIVVDDHYFNQMLSFNIQPYNEEEYKKKRESIVGKWQSKNDTSKEYWKYISEKRIKSGRTERFEGVVEYNILEDGTIQLKVGENEVENARWTLSKDCNVLLIEYEIEDDYIKGKHYEYCDILELTENNLNVKLYDYVYHKNIDNHMIYLNIFQNFKKDEDVK